MLTPILLAMAIDNVLTTLEKRAGERTIVWKSAIETSERTVHWDSVFSGLDAPRTTPSASLALLTNYLMANEFHDLAIRGVDVEIAHSDRLQSARIVHVEAQKERVRPGDAVPVWVDLEDFRGGPRRVVMLAKVPADAPAGSDDGLRRRRQRGDGVRPVALSAGPPLARPGPRLPRRACVRRTRSTCSPTAPAPGAVVAGEPLAALPPTRAALLHDRGPGDGTPDLGYLRLQSESSSSPCPSRGPRA